MPRLVSIDNVYNSLEGFAIKRNILIRRFSTNHDEWSRVISEDLSSFKEMKYVINDPWFFMRGCMLFHDQEPMMYQAQKKAWDKFIFSRTMFDDRMIILHSELNSSELDKFCRAYRAIPVHWFSNGALAFDWYSSDRFNLFPAEDFKIAQLQFKFSCLNRLIGQQRIYRPILSSMLESTVDHKHIKLSCNLIDPYSGKGALECIGDRQLPDEHVDLIRRLADKTDELLINIPEHEIKHRNESNDNASLLFRTSYFYYTFCHIATETMFYDDTLHLTEKSLRAFVNMRPMILVGPPKSLSYLRNYGFKTFEDYWDEGYDDEQDPNKRLNMIFDLIRELNKMSLKDMTLMLRKMEDLLWHNRNHFFNEFPNIMIKELKDNMNSAFDKYMDRKPNGWALEKISSLSDEELNRIKNLDHIPEEKIAAQIYENLSQGDSASYDDGVIRFLRHHIGLTDVDSTSQVLNKIYQILD